MELDLPAHEKLLLLVMLDKVHGDGGGMWTSVKTLAAFTGHSERRVKQIRSDLVDKGVLVRVGEGPHGSALYRANLEAVPRRAAFLDLREKGAQEANLKADSSSEGTRSASPPGSGVNVMPVSPRGDPYYTGSDGRITSKVMQEAPKQPTQPITTREQVRSERPEAARTRPVIGYKDWARAHSFLQGLHDIRRLPLPVRNRGEKEWDDTRPCGQSPQ